MFRVCLGLAYGFSSLTLGFLGLKFVQGLQVGLTFLSLTFDLKSTFLLWFIFLRVWPKVHLRFKVSLGLARAGLDFISACLRS